MWYQSEMLLRDRQEWIDRQVHEARVSRLAGGRPHQPVKPRRLRLLSRR